MAIAIWKAAYRFNTVDGTAPDNNQYSPDIAGLSGNRFIVSWTDTSNRYGLGSPDIIGQIAGATGTAVSAELGLSDTYQDGPQVAGRVAALSTGGFVSVYQTEDVAFFTTGQNVSYQSYGAPTVGDPAPYVATRAVGTPPFTGVQGIFQTGEETNPDVTSFADGSFFVVYEDSAITGDIRGVTISPTGVERAAFNVDNSAEFTSAPQVAALTSGNAVIVYQSLGSTQNVMFRVIGPTGGAALSSGTVAATASEEIAPAVAALTGGGFVVVWQDSEADGAGNSGILARIYSNGGVAAGAAFAVNIDVTAGAQSAPAVIGLADGGFLVAWVDEGSGTIRAREFNSAGVAQGVETVVADVDSLSQPSLTLLSDGRIGLAVTNTDGSSNKDVYVAILDTRGSVIDGSSSADVITSRVAGATVNGLGGSDTLYAMQGDDDLNGGAGDDTFVVDASSTGGTDDFDGGADTDTLRVDGGGTINLTSLSLTSVENITFSGAAGTNVTVTAAQAALISAATGTTDIVNISGNFNTNTALIKDLLDAGVEEVRWTSSVYGSATAVVNPSNPAQFIVTYNDDTLTRAFDYLRTTYDADGNRVAQEQRFDTGLNNGVLQQQVYNPATGGLISNVLTDTLGTRSFHTITTDFVNGVRSTARTINDNNTATTADDTIVDQTYDAAGVITLELTTDASPGGTGKPWVSIAREYAGGVTQIFRTTFDNGNRQVLGQAGAQEIEGGAGNDALLGGAGADSFVFAGSFGNDTIHDYLDGTDKLDFTAFNVDTRAELLAIATITAAGTSTLINLTAGGSVTIRNLTPGAIGDSDFVGMPVG